MRRSGQLAVMATTGMVASLLVTVACEPVGPRPAGAGGAARVIAVDPANGAVGVRQDAVLRITFDAPMSRDSVERAFTSDDLVAPAFAWDASDRIVTVTPAAPLRYAEAGVGPALGYRYRLGSDAKSASGQSVAVPFEGQFTTLRRFTVSLPSEAALDGYVRQDGNTDACDDDALYGVVCVGEAGNRDGAFLQYKGLLTFPLAPLPPGPLELEAAHVAAWQYSLGNKPYEEIGVVRLEHVYDLATIDEDAFRAGGDPVDPAFSTTPELGWKRSANVAVAVGADRAAGRPYAQFRLVFTVHRTMGMTYPLIARFYSGRVRFDAPDEATRAKHPRLDVVYLAP